MKKILVPCDFSAPSIEAFRMAASIASRSKGQIIVLHVIHLPVTYDAGMAGVTPLAYNPEFVGQIEHGAKKSYEKMKAGLRDPSIKTKLEIIQGDIVSTTIRVIGAKKADLVIMGTHGTSGLSEALIGSTTEKIVRHSAVPVLTVRKAPSLKSIKEILLPIVPDLNQHKFIRKVKELQAFFNATLHVLLINTPSHFRQDKEAHKELEEFALRYGLKRHTLNFRNYRDEEFGIIDFAGTEGMDLIVMATHARKGISHLLQGSLTEDVVNHTSFPLWSYHMNHR